MSASRLLFESSRLVVALDTASEHIALAIGRYTDDGNLTCIASGDHLASRQANVRLMPTLDALFAKHDLSRQDIACVLCGRGPGSFTGVRIGVATAKGLARGLGVPLFGVSTLDAVAWGAWLAGIRGAIGVVADAMRQEIYPARFELNDAGVTRLDPHAVAKAEDIAARWGETASQLILVGDGLKKYAELFYPPFVLGDRALWMPKGRGLLRAFEDACSQGLEGSGEAGALLPVYTRLSDAEENERKRLARGGQIAQGALVDVPLSGVADPALLRTVAFRPMATEDLNQVSALEKEIFPAGTGVSGECWTSHMFADDLARQDRIWWVAYVDDLLVGFAGAWFVDGALQVLDVAIAPSHRRQGIASELLNRLISDALSLGAATVSLEVRASNTEAQALYASLGFTQIGVRPRYYSPRSGGSRESAVIMAKGTAKNPLHVSCGPIYPNSAAHSDTSSASLPAHHLDSPSDLAKEFVAPVILAIETSCDETAAAVIDGEGHLLSDIVASQVDFHARFGGVVPEIASRKHTEAIVGVVDAALEKAGVTDWRSLDALAVTYAPGLIGALVVGVAFAKGLAWATELPLIRVNHLEGHIYANRLEANSSEPDNPEANSSEPDGLKANDPKANSPEADGLKADNLGPDGLKANNLTPPFIAALLSGGHTMLVQVQDWGSYRVLGQTLDDAAGEAFDKVAKALGLGYPGGPVISRLAKQGDPVAFDFPRALLHSHDYRFSLSGLKTAVITFIRKAQAENQKLNIPDVAASFQQAVIDVQVAKALMALEETRYTTFCVGGGVAANQALRDAYTTAMTARGIRVLFPPGSTCTDNAAMIARVALDRFHNRCFMSLEDDACAQADLECSY
jgi:N6-L-threonylcarbamoyladenine synthase